MVSAGKSPLLGSPWPYLMHKRKNHNAPAEHAGPTTVPEGTEQGDDAEVLSPLASCPEACACTIASLSSYSLA